MKFKNNKSGITLIVLTITIIILIILAGISISVLKNTNIIEKSQDAKNKTENSEKEQQTILGEYEKALNKNSAEKLTTDKMNKVLSTKKNTLMKDENENIFTVPAGFKIVVDETTNHAVTVDKGIVVEDTTLNDDGTKTSTNGSQFVWIPIGNIKKSNGTTVTINLNRYIFDEEGIAIAQDEKAINTGGKYNYQEIDTNSYGKGIAKSITNFKTSANKNGGFFLGRYEARRNSDGNLTESATDIVWNDITQPNATIQAQNMYNKTYTFTSDLINSYAWDTSVLFLQSCGNNVKYSRQNSLNTSISNRGTNDFNYIGTKDIQCNIYDMASNLREWTTENYVGATYPCVYRGGTYEKNDYYTSIRYSASNTDGYSENLGFRVILYL